MAKQNNIHYQKNAIARSGKKAIYYKGVRRESKNLASILKDVLYVIWFIIYGLVVCAFAMSFGILFGFITMIFKLIFNYPEHVSTHKRRRNY